LITRYTSGGKKEIKSVANITRKNVAEFLEVAAKILIKPEVVEFRIEEANEVLKMLKYGAYRRSGVLVIK